MQNNNTPQELQRTPMRVLYDSLTEFLEELKEKGLATPEFTLYINTLRENLVNDAMPYETLIMKKVFLEASDYSIEGFNIYLSRNFQPNNITCDAIQN